MRRTICPSHRPRLTPQAKTSAPCAAPPLAAKPSAMISPPSSGRASTRASSWTRWPSLRDFRQALGDELVDALAQLGRLLRDATVKLRGDAE